ncbi:MAG: PD40 domain-containing protein [Anaerolineae bacterium]|nr:PD40 domain-containing protein [Anaerolineae bacterium]
MTLMPKFKRIRFTFQIVLAFLLFAALACSATPDRTTGTRDQAPETTPAEIPPAAIQLITDLPSAGRLAVSGNDGNLYVIEREQEPVPITIDAVPSFNEELIGREYQHPTWSPSGWLSFVRVEILPDNPPSQILLAVAPGQTDSHIIHESTWESYIYGYWAPDNLPENEQLAFLTNDGEQYSLHLTDIQTGDDLTISDQVVGKATPYYFSWSPDGGSIFWQQNGLSMAVYNVAESRVVNQLDDEPGNFSAPVWSPVDDRLLYAREDNGMSRVTVLDDDTHYDLGLPVDGYTTFTWSPDGQTIAYSSGEGLLEPITVISADGSNGRILAGVDDIAAFFWSPDSTRLAVVTMEEYKPPLPEVSAGMRARPARQTGTPSIILQWWLIDVGSGEVTELDQFFPTPDQFTIFNFFSQYAQSHRIWSPDSRYIAYAEVADLSGSPSEGMIRLIDTERPDEEPLGIMEGRQAVYSFD